LLITLFTICFITGIVFAILSFLFGELIHLDVSIGDFPILSPTVISSFITVFGGTGLYLLKTTHLHLPAVLGISISLAVLLSLAMIFLVIYPLHKASVSLSKNQRDAIGLVAEVITSFKGNQRGEILFTISGSRVSGSASSKTNDLFASGEKVTIADVAGSIYYVEKLKEENENE
jgi:membrane protein implicated in regulation of membrane protease activity